MKIKRTDRGFSLIEFRDWYGQPCTLQKSSLATRECIWLGIENADPKVMASDAAKVGVQTTQTTGWVQYPIPPEVSFTTRMHLTRSQVKALLPHLLKFVDTGEI